MRCRLDAPCRATAASCNYSIALIALGERLFGGSWVRAEPRMPPRPAPRGPEPDSSAPPALRCSQLVANLQAPLPAEFLALFRSCLSSRRVRGALISASYFDYQMFPAKSAQTKHKRNNVSPRANGR